jgi:hypothetical protein
MKMILRYGSRNIPEIKRNDILIRSSSMAKRQPPAMRTVSASERRAVKKPYEIISDQRCIDNQNQLPDKMKAREEKQIRHLQILKDAGLHHNKSFATEKQQLAHMAKCDAAIEAAERGCYGK